MPIKVQNQTELQQRMEGQSHLWQWYVGISGDVEAQLTQHRAPIDEALVLDAKTEVAARAIKLYFRDFCHTLPDGQGGGNSRSQYVYAYLTSPTTDPSRADAGLARHTEASGYRRG